MQEVKDLANSKLDNLIACLQNLDRAQPLHDIHYTFNQLEFVLRFDLIGQRVFCVDKAERAMFMPLKAEIEKAFPEFKIIDITRVDLAPQFMTGAKRAQGLFAHNDWKDNAVNRIEKEMSRAPLQEVTNTQAFKR